MIKITKVVTGEVETEVTVSYSVGKKTATLTVSENVLKLRAQKAADLLKRGVTEQDLLDAVKVVVEEKRAASTVAEPTDLGVYINSDLEKEVPAPITRKRVVVPVAFELVPPPPPEPEPPTEEEPIIDPETGLPIIPDEPEPEPEVPDEKEAP